MLGSPILYLKGMRAIMFQLSGFYYSGLIDQSRVLGYVVVYYMGSCQN